nr:unnamed protein product [Spirometra erinaceieuropaei]
MFSANALLQSPYTITIPVDHHPVKFGIDTGSAVTLINEASLRKLLSLLPASSIFRSYTGQNIEDLLRDDSATHYRGPPGKFQFQSDFRPRFFKALTVPYAVAPKVEEELDRLQNADIIEPVQYSEWAAPIVPVLKSDGSVLISGDYKLTINSATKLNPYPLPRIEDLHDCCLVPADFFELATTTNLRGHPLKLRVTGAKLVIRKFFFSNRVIEAWNALPTDVVMSTSVEAFKRKLDQCATKRHNAT